MNFLILLLLLLLGLKASVQILLEKLNTGELMRHSVVPRAFSSFIDQKTYQKSIDYTLAKSRLSQFKTVYQFLLLFIIVEIGALEIYNHWFSSSFNLLPKVWLQSIYLFSFLFLLSLLYLPFNLYNTFFLEQQFGFNNMTFRLWLKDFIKSFLISLLLSIPLLAFIFYLLEHLGRYWWIWSWLAVVAFQLLMQIIYPKLILPLFNKLTPLPEGDLRNRILSLANRLNFKARDILVMDGSKRSKHSNAFFTGIGSSKMVVFFDTLVRQLSVEEMSAVFAHEVGHYKKKHILKGMIISVLELFVVFFLVDYMMRLTGFNLAFGLPSGEAVHTILILSVFSSSITFWLSPLGNIFSRKNEYEADRYAKVALMGESQPLIEALKKLYKENLGNLTPHRFYSFFYYSHPTLLERERKLVGDLSQP